jgi:hypothetical protein
MAFDFYCYKIRKFMKNFEEEDVEIITASLPAWAADQLNEIAKQHCAHFEYSEQDYLVYFKSDFVRALVLEYLSRNENTRARSR